MLYSIEKLIELQSFDKPRIGKIKTGKDLDILSNSLRKGVVYPKHCSPRAAHLFMLKEKHAFI
ncbi:hypothetical protein JM83_2592 [Gillisia sp. Hel_I_86]|nr:hypothetical protein JM83_2592 [Gillisia sp. Hel_I_86]